MKILSLLFLMFAAAPSFGRPFQSRFEAERIVTEIHKIADDSVIDDRMLNYVFFDSGACHCPKEVQERRKKIYLDQMGDEFNFYKHYYQENLSEVNSILQFQLDDFLNDSAFLRTSHHVLANKVFTGCTDFTKAFIQTALDKGYDAESMRVVFLMEQEAYVKSCADRAGQPGRPWTQGGHHVVALKIADQWEVMNTTSPHPEFYLSGLQLPERLNPVNFIQVPMKLIYAGGFDVADYLNAFTFKTIYNIYVSGSPNSNICH